MALFRARPNFVDAVLYNGKNYNEVETLIERVSGSSILGLDDDDTLSFYYGQDDNPVYVRPGYYVVIDENSYLCIEHSTWFRAQYQKATFEEEEERLRATAENVIRNLRN